MYFFIYILGDHLFKILNGIEIQKNYKEIIEWLGNKNRSQFQKIKIESDQFGVNEYSEIERRNLI